jgi:3-dehydroquinate dehydratase II
MKILIINGPNLNLLGKRQPEIYGFESFEAYLVILKGLFPDDVIDYFQSNHEGELIDKIQQSDGQYDGIIINAGGYTHTSVAIGDTVASISTPCIEVHISNIFSREDFRKISYLSAHCKAVISGCGLDGYEFGVREIMRG